MSRLFRFLKHPSHWPVFLIPILLALWGQFGALRLGATTFRSAMYYQSPYLGPLEPGDEGDPIAARVVLVVVDGLREDASREMPTLNALRAQGADRVVEAGLFSFTLPSSAVIGTGARQEQNGFNSNFPEDAVEIDTIFLAAKRAGLTTALVAEPMWSQLYDVGVDLRRTIPAIPEAEYTNLEGTLAHDREMADHAIQVLQVEPDFAVLYLPGVDMSGHGFGNASDEYLETALNSDAQIARMLAEIDLTTTAVLITADHGHIAAGGHGGGEPEVLRVPLVAVGRGIRPGEYLDAQQVDLAPTIAVLLGTSIPAHNMGDPLVDMLDAPEALLVDRQTDHAAQIANRYDAMLRVIGATPSLEDTGAADRVAQWEVARAARLTRERLLRLPVALLVLLPALLYLWWWRRSRWEWRVPLTLALLYFILWNINFFAIRQLTYSASWLSKDADLEKFFESRVIESMLLLVLLMLALGVWRFRAAWLEIAREAANTLFLIALGLLVQILIFYVWWNITFSWVLADAQMGFKYYVDVFQTTVFWPMLPLPLALILPLLALGAAGLLRLIARGRPAPHDRPVPVG